MTILLAVLIAVVALSLMMTVLVASTRPLRGYDEPMFNTRPASRANRLTNGPHWMDLGRTPPPSADTLVPRQTENPLPSLPLPSPTASTTPESSRPRGATPSLDVSTPRRMANGHRPINPNTWGRIRAEVGALETLRHARSVSG